MITNYIRAGYPVLWAHALELKQAEETLGAQIKALNYHVYSWDIQAGVKSVLNGNASYPDITDPVALIAWLSSQDQKTVLFAHNFHRFLDSIEVIQAIQNGLMDWKSTNKTLIILSPVVSMPIELERMITTIEVPLPDRESLSNLIDDMKTGAGMTPETVIDKRESVIDSALGLTFFEAENAMALSLIEEKSFVPSVIYRQKTKLIEQNSALEVSLYPETFKDLGGLENLKKFTYQVASSPLSRGVLLVGVPGCGKSLFSKALGNELNIPTYSLDFGRVFGSKVGESEEKIRRALQIIDLVSPAVLFIDELEKGIGGIASSNKTDGGTGSRVFGTFLTWLNDHKSRVFVIATTNDISQLPPEFLRAERWDGVFFVDLPTDDEQDQILKIHAKSFEIDLKQPAVNLSGWSGAEIRSLCRISKMMGVSLVDASRFIIPLSKSMAGNINALKDWAKNRAIPASEIKLKPEQKGGKRIVSYN